MNKHYIHAISKEIFEISLITYLVLIIIETFRPGFASNFLNINYFLIVILLSGFMAAVIEPDKTINSLPAAGWAIKKVRNPRRKRILVTDIMPRKIIFEN